GNELLLRLDKDFDAGGKVFSAGSIIAASQGIHIVIPRHFLPGEAAIMIPKTEDGRVLFAVPWHDHVVVGTTDTPVASAKLEPRALREEREFVMTHACKYLNHNPQPEDVCSIFAGLRPLVRPDNSSGNTAALSRDHSIIVSQSGLITLTGGKWTTYRKMAEDVIDQAETLAGLEHQPCPTVNLQIRGWTHEPIKAKNLQIYGSDAREIENLIKITPALAEKIHPDLPYQKAEVFWHAQEEMARTVEDVLARRTRALFLNARASMEAAPLVASILAKVFSRDSDWQKKQVEAYLDLAEGYDFLSSKSIGN
ncbi:MAG: glycerol-3-phosphate dehydrogenase/oxidase, partial [Opitutales bacterium]